MMGIRLTRVCSRRMNSMSICLRLQGNMREAQDEEGSDVRMTSGLNEVEAGVDTVVHNFLPVDAVLLLQVGVKTGLDVIQDRPPTEMTCQRRCDDRKFPNLSSLLTKSPKPGVSTTVRCRRTPFSSMSDGMHLNGKRRKKKREQRTCTDAFNGDCLWMLSGGGERLFGRVERGVEESVNERRLSEARFALGIVSRRGGWRRGRDGPTTMVVNWKPLRTLFLWTWFGRFAKPT